MLNTQIRWCHATVSSPEQRYTKIHIFFDQCKLLIQDCSPCAIHAESTSTVSQYIVQYRTCIPPLINICLTCVVRFGVAKSSRTPQMSDISQGINVSNFIAFQCKTPRFGEVILQSRVQNRGTHKFTFSLTDVNHLCRTVPHVLAMLNLPQQSRSILSKYRICIPQLIKHLSDMCGQIRHCRIQQDPSNE